MKNWLATALMGATAATASAESSGYARFAQTTDTIRILGNTVFTGTDWTYEMRIRIDPNAASQARGHILSEQRDALEGKILAIRDGQVDCETIRGYVCGDIAQRPVADLLDRWLHVAWVRAGPELSLYLDGTLDQVWYDRPSCTTDRPDSWMAIGMMRYGAGFVPSAPLPSFLGDLDWIRITAGALYNEDFTPPYECELTSAADTQLLLRFNEPAGTAILIDESPNAFVCEVGIPVAPGVKSTSPALGITEDGFPACRPTCPADIDENALVDGVDLAIVLSRWGTLPTDYPRADTNGDGTVDGSDLAILLSGWGACP
jgi:hypothetical protein